MLEAPTSTLTWEGDRVPLAKALIVAQLASDAIKKANENDHFKSKYADLAAVVEAVVPALNAAGVGVIQSPAFDGEFVTVETMFIHEAGSSVTSLLRLRPSKLDAQGVGSAITYGRRYALLAMTGAAPEDDDGNAASGPRDLARKDYGPAAIGDDFPGASGRGKSSNAAKKDGTDIRFQELRQEIWGLESRAAKMAWQNARTEEIKTFPEAWRKQLREDLEEQTRAIIDPAEVELA